MKAGLLIIKYRAISRNTVDIERMEIFFEDGVKSVRNFYRSVSQSKESQDGRRYPEPRPTVVGLFFHGVRIY